MKDTEKFLSLKWFKEHVEAIAEKVIERKINKIFGEIPEETDEEETPYLLIKMVNNSLTVIMRDGEVFSKPEATEVDYINCKSARNRDEILDVIEDRVVANEMVNTRREAAKINNTITGYKLLSTMKDFTVEGEAVCLRGTSRSIPPLLVSQFTEIIGRISAITPSEHVQDVLDTDDEYQGLKNFFMWCCLNPRADVAATLYDFLERNSFRITKQGFFVALRNVVTISNAEENELVKFVSNAYNKIKAVWKRDPALYSVVVLRDDTYQLVHNNDTNPEMVQVGNLKDLYLDLPNMAQNRFTDAHTRTFDIRVGQVVNMPMEKCSWSTVDCAEAGLHFTSDQIHYVGCGDTSVLILINPMKVVGIGQHKGRCYEYLPIMTVPRDEATSILHDGQFDTYQLDEDYAIKELESLAEKAKKGFTVESSKYNFNMPSMSSAELNSIVLSLSEMKKTITKRISLIE